MMLAECLSSQQLGKEAPGSALNTVLWRLGSTLSTESERGFLSCMSLKSRSWQDGLSFKPDFDGARDNLGTALQR